MAPLPDPTATLAGDDLATYRAMTDRRGEGHLGDVYGRMFNDPAVARLVGDLGAHLRYEGTLPGDVRELVILHLARRLDLPYVWVHHLNPADAAGLPPAAVDAVAREAEPPDLSPLARAALRAADAVLDLRSIPDDDQAEITRALGTGAVVELVALVGLYQLIGGTVRAFDIDVEPAFVPRLPAWTRPSDRP
jgi:4-carboxymuconolactone decarboxylase